MNISLIEYKEKAMKITLIVLGFIFLSTSYASGRHDDDVVIENTVEIYESYEIQMGDMSVGIASAQHHFDWSTSKWQGSIGMGHYDGDSALSAGLAKRYDEVLINLNVVKGDELGGGLGVGWRF